MKEADYICHKLKKEREKKTHTHISLYDTLILYPAKTQILRVRGNIFTLIISMIVSHNGRPGDDISKIEG